jgi:transposase
MNSVTPEVGIDVDSIYLVTSIDQAKPVRIRNEELAIRPFIASLPPGALIHLEASGGYERVVRRLLRESGFTVRTHNPLKARRLAQARGPRAKTDPLDAVGLSRSGHLLPPTSTRTDERQKLADLSRAKEAITRTAGQYKVRAKAPDLDEDARTALLEVIEFLESKAKELEKQFETRVRATSYFREYQLCQSLDGVGKATARVITCELPEDFMERTGPELCSYGALAPVDCSSGKRGRASLGKGNTRLKKALYMPALWALGHQTWAKELYARLRAKGRPHNSAIVAVMRRLFLRIIAVLHRGTPWIPEPTP